MLAGRSVLPLESRFRMTSDEDRRTVTKECTWSRCWLLDCSYCYEMLGETLTPNRCHSRDTSGHEWIQVDF